MQDPAQFKTQHINKTLAAGLIWKLQLWKLDFREKFEPNMLVFSSDAK